MNRRNILKGLSVACLVPLTIVKTAFSQPVKHFQSCMDFEEIERVIRAEYGYYIKNFHVTSNTTGDFIALNSVIRLEDGIDSTLHPEISQYKFRYNEELPLGSYEVTSQDKYIRDIRNCINCHTQDMMENKEVVMGVDIFLLQDIKRGPNMFGCSVGRCGMYSRKTE